ncbi:hypothetical protein SAMN05216480_11296 [Pustulibacterium marinum]|uniref:DUF1508 domain-containing protein n=1 Tax=Pustulibacterium marinum TaxID=1224947 RepID=A0A1I7I2F5_9FLAO|nr:DUF1508 domain-containing protein [Pustulibacterium marinum]SFU67104.1 hypothetical protein SAMN05216480_11296 [Pustulibacterium marinum]
MSVFVINKRFDGNYKFVFSNRKGKIIFTSISCKRKSDCQLIIEALQNNYDMFVITKTKTPRGKFFFRVSKGGLVLASSRRYASDYSLQKGIDYANRWIEQSEMLDLPEEDDVFSTPAEDIFTS